MKKQLLKVVNGLLRPIDAKLVRRSGGTHSDWGMEAMLERLVQRKIAIQSVIDIGASDGSWSRECMSWLPNANYLAIEPLEERKQGLDSVKGKFPNFDYALCVAGDVDGQEVTLNVTPDLDGSTVDGQSPGVPRTCQVRTIDALAAEKKLSGPYLLKFDTHGYELPILAGCKDVLANTAAIIMEAYNFQLTPDSLRFHEMCTHLEAAGFRTADIASPMLRQYDKAFWQIDLLFLRTDAEVFKYQQYR